MGFSRQEYWHGLPFPSPAVVTYTVVRGDCLWKIAKKLLGDGKRWVEIYAANSAYIRGDYDGSADTWREVLRFNANYNMAFRGIGRALLRQGAYREAMDYFEMAHDRPNYGRAFRLYRKEWVEKNIWWVFLAIALLLIVPVLLGRIKRMKWEVIMHEHSKVRK